MSKRNIEILKWTGILWYILTIIVGIPLSVLDKEATWTGFFGLGAIALVLAIIIERIPLNK